MRPTKPYLTKKEKNIRQILSYILMLGAVLGCFLFESYSKRNIWLKLLWFVFPLLGLLGFILIIRYCGRNFSNCGIDKMEFLKSELLNNKNEDYRIAAAIRLRELGDVSAWDALSLAKDDPHPDVREEVRIALEALSGKRGMSTLQELGRARESRQPVAGSSGYDALSNVNQIDENEVTSVHKLGSLMRAGDVMGIEKFFHFASDWNTRETVALALSTMVTGKATFDAQAMNRALLGIIEVCQAESGGDSYRMNCLKIAQEALERIS